ncbi:MAG: hypothetical protein ACLFRP_05530 [Puniceicoccaceae bacterium]
MRKDIHDYLSRIGREGGRKSRRRLSTEDARRMVKIREARKLYRKFHARCFWSAPADLTITGEDLDWVIRKLREQGGREGWEAAARLCR